MQDEAKPFCINDPQGGLLFPVHLQPSCVEQFREHGADRRQACRAPLSGLPCQKGTSWSIEGIIIRFFKRDFFF